MLFGVLLVLIWLVLLVRYPAKSLPVSLIALIALLALASWAGWQQYRDDRALAAVVITLSYAPHRCVDATPLHTHVRNSGSRTVDDLRWRVAAYRPDQAPDLSEDGLAAPDRNGPTSLEGGVEWEGCQPLPRLKAGYRAETLQFRAERVEGSVR